jgi:hypothetical protein
VPLHWQAPATQLAPEGQALPQLPQLAASVCGFTQLAPQAISVPLHIVPPVPVVVVVLVVDPPAPPAPPVPVVVVVVVVLVVVPDEVEASPPQPPLIAVRVARVVKTLASKMDNGLCIEHLFKSGNDKSGTARGPRGRSDREHCAPPIMPVMKGRPPQQIRKSPAQDAWRNTGNVHWSLWLPPPVHAVLHSWTSLPGPRFVEATSTAIKHRAPLQGDGQGALDVAWSGAR